MAEGSHFWQALSDTIQRVVNLKIVTLVGDAQVSGTIESLQISAPAAPSGALVTDINLAAGDVTTIISEKLLGQEDADLRALHQAAVTQARQIVARNVEILVSIVKQIGDQIKVLPDPSHPDAGSSSAPPPAQ
jgi:hypothetical protein